LNQQLIADGKLDTPLENGDELMLFPAIAGG
jgi:molybdopterin converting factor small subunit